MFWALPGGANVVGAHLTQTPDQVPTDVHSVGSAFFRELHARLLAPLPEIDGGPFYLLHRFGNLWLPDPIGRELRIDAATMLAFELSVYFRHHTDGRATFVQGLAPPPAFGRPCAHVTAKFINATLGGDLVERHVKHRLRALPSGVRLAPWPEVGQISEINLI